MNFKRQMIDEAIEKGIAIRHKPRGRWASPTINSVIIFRSYHKGQRNDECLNPGGDKTTTSIITVNRYTATPVICGSTCMQGGESGISDGGPDTCDKSKSLAIS